MDARICDRRQRRWLLLPLIVLAAALPAAGAGPPAAPGLSGSWRLVPQRSDDVRGEIVASLGSAYTKGDVRDDSPRVWIREWLLRQAEQPGDVLLTVEQDAKEFRSGLGDDVRIYYFGREATRQGPLGGLRRANVRREGERVVVEEKAVKGGGRIEEAYQLQPDGSLLVGWRLEHKTLQKPLDLRLVFERATPQR